MPIVNTMYKPHLELGQSDSQWDALQTLITDYLETNADTAVVTTSALRALDAAFDDDILWAQITSDLNLIEVP